MKRLIYLCIAAAVLILGGCNTLEGAGEDIEAVGDEMKEEAREHKGY